MRFLHKLVADSGLRTALLHGERSQEEREAAMADFRSGKAQVGGWGRGLWRAGAGDAVFSLLITPSV